MMKKALKIILEFKLRFLAKLILRKYNPAVVAITGSVGKTFAKEAIYTVLSSTYNVRRNLKNYNNEIGLPLTIIGSEPAGKSIIGWTFVLLRACKIILIKDKNYPDILVLEMGADRPGDIKKLCRLTRPNVGVATQVSEAHTEFFGNVEDVAEEKGELVKALSETGQAVLNYDNKFVHKMKDITKAGVTFFGMTPEADVSAIDVEAKLEKNKAQTSFTVKYLDQQEEIVLSGVLAPHLVYGALAAISVGIIYDLDIITIAKSFVNIKMPKGRMRFIPGIKGTFLIDDTYNSSPLAAEAAIKELAKIQSSTKKYAVLGDMLELGSVTEAKHQELGRLIAMQNIDYLVTVGELSLDIIRGAVAANMSKDNCFNFKNSSEAGLFLQSRIQTGDVLLIKGSQGVRMEKIVKELMAEPDKAEDLLVRQGKSWLK